MSNIKDFNKIVERIAANVKQLRKERKLTQEEMRELGFDYRHFQRLESGKHAPSLFTLYRLSKAFKVDIRELLR